jgi:hypothetical protein
MTSRFASRPGREESWVKTPPTGGPDRYTARLTIDVTPELRGRIKIIAFERHQTVAEMIRELLERHYGADGLNR